MKIELAGSIVCFSFSEYLTDGLRKVAQIAVFTGIILLAGSSDAALASQLQKATEKGKNSTPKDKKELLLVNIAADALVEYPLWGGDIDSLSKDQAVKALRSYVDEFAGTQITTLLFNVNYQRACFDSKVMESFWDIQEPEKIIAWPRKHWQLHKKGIDPFQVSIGEARLKMISPWISIRMNDHHYLDDPNMINKLMAAHPEYRRTPTSMFNYAVKEVRDFYKSFISETLDRYDVDGIELDWMRTHQLFKAGEEMEGNAIINEFMKEVRILVNQKAAKRGHPIKILARTPATPEIGRAYGLDAVSWVKNGSVDILTPTNWYTPTNFDIPVERWKAQIGTDYKYLLAPGSDLSYQSASGDYQKQMRNSIEPMRAFTVSAFSRGADAIYLFNNFGRQDFVKKVVNPDGTFYSTSDRKLIFTEAGALSTSIGKPRRHVLTFTQPDTKPASEVLPETINPQNPVTFKIYTGPKTAKDNYIVRVGLESLPGFETAKLRVHVNDKLSDQIADLVRVPSYVYDNSKKWEAAADVSETSARMMQFKVNPADVKNGYNSITIINSRADEQKIIWLEVYVD